MERSSNAEIGDLRRRAEFQQIPVPELSWGTPGSVNVPWNFRLPLWLEYPGNFCRVAVRFLSSPVPPLDIALHLRVCPLPHSQLVAIIFVVFSPLLFFRK